MEIIIGNIYINAVVIFEIRNLSSEGGGGLIISTFFQQKFSWPTRSFQGYITVWSRGDQALDTHVNSKIWLYFTMQKNVPNKNTFSAVFTNLIKVG